MSFFFTVTLLKLTWLRGGHGIYCIILFLWMFLCLSSFAVFDWLWSVDFKVLRLKIFLTVNIYTPVHLPWTSNICEQGRYAATEPESWLPYEKTNTYCHLVVSPESEYFHKNVEEKGKTFYAKTTLHICHERGGDWRKAYWVITDVLSAMYQRAVRHSTVFLTPL